MTEFSSFCAIIDKKYIDYTTDAGAWAYLIKHCDVLCLREQWVEAQKDKLEDIL